MRHARTKAIIPVHLYGQLADMRAVMEIAARHGLVVIEDAAQAIGAEYEGRRCGSIGHYGCLSFFPSKNLGAAGDAGMIVTNDPERAEKLRCLRSHGSKPKYYHRLIGGNFRLDAIQAAIVSTKLRHLDEWTKRRNENADRYGRLFGASGLSVLDSREWTGTRQGTGVGASDIGDLVLPSAVQERHIFNQYVVRVPSRDLVKSGLTKRGVGTEVYYPVPMHLQECFSYLGYGRGAFPESELAANSTLALPIYPELTDDQAAHVVESLKESILELAERGQTRA